MQEKDITIGKLTPLWEWKVFGNDIMVVTIYEGQEHIVTWWRKLITRIFFGSTWRKL